MGSMDLSDGEFPQWMVPNGMTLTIAPDIFRDRLPDGVSFVTDRSWTSDRAIPSVMVLLSSWDWKIVRGEDSAGLGWTSIACGSDETGWFNLAVMETQRLIEVLTEAASFDRNEGLRSGHDDFLDTPVDDEAPDMTFRAMLMEATAGIDNMSRAEAVTALERVAAVWGLLFDRFRLYETKGSWLNALMYADNMGTYALLENGPFLAFDDSTALSLDDLSIASSLIRLRKMTRAVAEGADIDKRCRQAISAHMESKPAIADVYRQSDVS